MSTLDGGDGGPDFPVRFHASRVLRDLDDESQLIAIRETLRLHEEAERLTNALLDELKEQAESTTGIYNDFVVQEWIENLHRHVYQDAAHSMAAVGMLAPFIEAVFCQAFKGIGSAFFATQPACTHDRFAWAFSEAWDCHYVWSKKDRDDDLVRGIEQLAEATELVTYLPEDWKKVVSALFSYRNKMFHCGFEWPKDERDRFWTRATSGAWPKGWFLRATQSEETWIVYMSDEFVQRCVTFADELIEGIGKYCKERSRNRSGS